MDGHEAPKMSGLSMIKRKWDGKRHFSNNWSDGDSSGYPKVFDLPGHPEPSFLIFGLGKTMYKIYRDTYRLRAGPRFHMVSTG